MDQPYRYEQYLGGVAFKDGRVDLRLLPAIEKGEQALAKALKIQDPKDRDEEVRDGWKGLKVDGPRKEWFGLKSRFFAVLMAPDGDAQRLLDSYEFRLSSPEAQKKAGGFKNLAASARMDEIRLGGSRKAMQFTLYAGPLRKETLKDVKDASELVSYGGGCFVFSGLVNLIAPLILGMLNFCASIFRNYGVGIIMTTLLIRLFQMQALSPKIQALRARHKDDQQKFGVEQMKLFKEHKINPLSGCLPLLLQMPIFIGMYSVFEMAIELRRAPFTLWMGDLSQPDQLLSLQTTVVIPILITDLRIDALNLLPILMTITWFLQAYFTPRSPDPQMASQQKMMMAMPVFFGFMCYGLASGLSLYFLVNSLLGMAEQKLIKKVFLKLPQSLAPA
jgi:YidC/Oxa1 family membrane protein insertase